MMRQMTEKEFLFLCSKGGIVPVYKEIFGDLETPVSAYMKLTTESQYSFLLESVEGGEKLARYSFLARDPDLVIRSKGGQAETLTFRKGQLRVKPAAFIRTPLEIIRELLNSQKFVSIPGFPKFCGGFVGYMSYDIVRFFERLPDQTQDDLVLPDLLLMRASDLVIFDHWHHTIKLVSCVTIDASDNNVSKCKKFSLAMKAITRLEKTLSHPLPGSSRAKVFSAGKYRSNCTQARYKLMVEQARDKIKAGDIIQVVLSQRFEVDVRMDAVVLYRSLRALNPSPYMFLLNCNGLSLVGASPEMLVRCEDGLVETRPIAGTRPRGKTAEEDVSLAKDLLADPKEIAEHVMLVDLGRNDLGRVCQAGSVAVTDLMSVEKYSHVMHIVSNIQGRLKEEYDALAALEAVFPAGTLSGAPKVRAMEIIDELESTRRGPYGGCVGWFSFSGDMDTCITIRTVLLTKNKAYIQAGAGIVADSDPSREYDETVNKAKAQVRALEIAAGFSSRK